MSETEPTFTDLDFIACMLSPCPGEPRWWCLREDLREKYRADARKAITDWANHERKTMAKLKYRRPDGDADDAG